MADVLGFNVPISGIKFSGLLSNSWIWVLIVGVIGFILIILVGTLLYFKTYNRKIIIFQGNYKLDNYRKRRGRVIFLKHGGVEVMKVGREYVSAYGETMGKNTYWYERGDDGYLRNFVLTKTGQIKYLDDDVRMFHEAIDIQTKDAYGTTQNWQMVVSYLMVFVIAGMLILAIWLSLGKYNESKQLDLQISEKNLQIIEKLDGLLSSNPQIKNQIQQNNQNSGLSDAT